MASPLAKPKQSLDSFLSYLHQQPVAAGQGSSAADGADLDPEAIADLIWLAVHQPATAWAQSRSSWTSQQLRQKKTTKTASDTTSQGETSSASSSQGTTATSTMGSTVEEAEQAPSHLEAQLLPQASVPGSERLPVWVNDPLELLDPQQLYEAVLPLMQPVAADQPAGLDEAATLDHYLQWRQVIPVWQADQHYRFSLTLILDQGFSMIVWQPLLEHIRDRLRGFHGFKDIQVLLWDNKNELPVSSTASASGERLAVVISDCAGTKWRNNNGSGPGAAFTTLQRLGADQPLGIWQVLPSWMWARTALGQGDPVALRRSGAGARWPFQMARPPGGVLPGAVAVEHPLPVFELTPEGMRCWGDLMGGSPFQTSSGILLPPETCDASPDAGNEEESGDQARSRQGQREEQDPLMPLRRFQHLASLDARRLMALFAAAPVLTLPVMRLIQAALLEETGTAALAEVVLSGLLRPVNHNSSSKTPGDPEAVQFSFAPPIREALLRQQSPTSTLQVIEEVTDFIAAHWNRKGWGSFRAFLLDRSIAAPPGQENSQHFANLAADIIAALGGPYASFADRLRQAQRKDPWPRNLFRFEQIESEAAQLLRVPEPAPVVYTTVMELVLVPETFSYSFASAGGERRSGKAIGYREPLAAAGSSALSPQGLSSRATKGTTSLPMLPIPPGRF
ncbi:MAG: SAV_2336 N-terminal domain-related protein, partial [Cyanobium sp.]